MEPFIAMIVMFGGNFAPRGWALCDGQLLPISQNQALFSILGTTYGGDGRTTFGLPDLRGRFAMHEGQGAGLSNRPLGQKGGTETNTLNVTQMPSHTHTATTTVNLGVNGTANSNEVSGKALANTASTNIYSTDAPDTALGGNVNTTITNAGGSQPVNNLQPFQCVNFIIALTGTFPSRN